MPFKKSYDESLPITSPPCIHMRSKAMYVTGSIHAPDHADEDGSHYCWCNVTQHILGPDQQNVDRPQCVPGRSCYQPNY